MADLTVSAGYNARTQRAPDRAPERADSHGASVRSSSLGKEEEEGLEVWVRGRWVREESKSIWEERRETRRDAKNSLEANHAAVPPVSLNIVPVCPSQRPLGPEVRRMLDMMVKGPGRVLRIATTFRLRLGGSGDCTAVGAGLNFLEERGMPNGIESIWTCILHLTSSIGVL